MLLGLAGCGPVDLVVTPAPPRPIAFLLCSPNTDFQLEGASVAGPFTFSTSTDEGGNVSIGAWPRERTVANLHIRAEGMQPYDLVLPFPAGPGSLQFHIGDCGVVGPLTATEVQLPAFTWPTDTGERGRVHVEAQRFVREDGSIFPWRGTDGFLLYQHWLTDSTGIDSVVRDWLTCGGGCNARGPNVVRVLGMVNSFSHLWPQEHLNYYDELGPFADHLWSAFHLRIEFVIFADAQIIMPDAGAEQRHATRVLEALAGKPNIFLEVSNEPFKNLPGGGLAAADLGRTLQNHGPPIASGDYDEPWHTALDYITVHTDRGAEWPRKAKDLLDIRSGDVGQDIGGWRSPGPVVGDEPMGFAEIERPGSRSTSADDAAQFAATCQLFAAGCTFHSDAGIAYGPLGPIQAAAAAAFFQALAFVTPAAQFAPYQRGEEFGGAGIGNMPLEHTDALALRTFCKAVNGSEYCVAIRPAPGWTPIARDGWTIADQPRRGLVRLQR